MRHERAKPLLLELKKHIEHKIAQVSPQSPLAAAMHYMLNQWSKLMGYLADLRALILIIMPVSGQLKTLLLVEKIGFE